MNGRVYDPLLGKFLSGDPLIQDPTNGQSYNRYSYVLNNPTNLTDPTGFESVIIGGHPYQWVRSFQLSEFKDAFADFWRTLVRTKPASAALVLNNAGKATRVISVVRVVSIVGVVYEVVSSGELGDGTLPTDPNDLGALMATAALAQKVFSNTVTPNGLEPEHDDRNKDDKERKVKKKSNCDGHHICTDKNKISTKNGGPWTPRFQQMFDKAGMKLNDSENIVKVLDHAGPHPEAYHDYVYSFLRGRTADLTGQEYATALRQGLRELGTELRTPGSPLNKLVTKP